MFVVAHFHMVMGVAPILVIFGGDLPLVPEGHRPHARRDARASSTSGSPSSAPTRSSSRCTTSGSSACRAATTSSATRPSSRHSAHTLNAFITIVALIVGVAAAGVPVQPDLEPASAASRRRQSVARHDARMADAGDAAGARQLGQGAAGRLSLGLRLQRARAPRRTSSRRTSRRRRGRLEERRHEHHPPASLPVLGVIAGWWLSRQRLMSKPWLEAGRGRRVPRHRRLGACRRPRSGSGCSSPSSARCSRCSSAPTSCA